MSVFAQRFRWRDGDVVTIHNLADERRTIRLELGADDGARAVDLLGDRRYEPLVGGSPEVRLDGYGYRWLRLR